MDTGSPDSKRQRLHMSQGLTQTTESTAGPSQTVDLTVKLKALEESFFELKANHAAEVSRLQTTISEHEARSVERVKGWEDLQHRYESLNNEFHKIRKERDDLVSEKTKVEQKVARHQEEITKLKDERTQLKHDLEAARDDIKAQGGSKEELEEEREKNRQLSQKYASLERRVKYESGQAAYVLQQYQTASTEGANLATERNELKTANEELSRRLATEAAKLSELKMQNDQQKHLARIEELEQSLEARDTLLRKKEEEIRNFRNNRPATRATSTQPRSPKSWGNGSRPTSPGVNNNGVGNRVSGLRFSSEMSF
jgi:chromosome segregation ATPase